LLDPVIRAVYDTKRAKRVVPFEINLSSRPAGQQLDEIVGCEPPETWKLQPEKYFAT
jgi:hypothetical protein